MHSKFGTEQDPDEIKPAVVIAFTFQGALNQGPLGFRRAHTLEEELCRRHWAPSSLGSLQLFKHEE